MVLIVHIFLGLAYYCCFYGLGLSTLRLSLLDIFASCAYLENCASPFAYTLRCVYMMTHDIYKVYRKVLLTK